ncbi:alpha/beta hydrolase [Robiginitalea sp. M366]|nr:alpha/beta fold hydrolase [Robiginitalea aestuariiviva]MDG1573477.1 alpha/beta hydrolase [Robiginitalea aestuariiviva]
MPGMAASPEIFEHLKLPGQAFHVEYLEWFVPRPGMSLQEYAREMAAGIRHKHPVLVGVSFGGFLVQEMAAWVQARKVIIISSIKCKAEMPRRLLLARYTKLHKLLPTSLVENVEVLARYAFGDPVTRRLELYDRYLSMRDKTYLDWALEQIVNWKRDSPLPGLVHIHGEQDAVFPIGHIGPCIRVPGGTHTMIIHRFRWFNQHLPAIILEDQGSNFIPLKSNP